jgi:hypothetical protein
MSLVAIRRALLELRARRLSAEDPVWELSGPWWPFSRRARRFETVRVEILEAARALTEPLYLVIDENPQEFDVGGSWAHAQSRTWVVPEGCDLAVLGRRVLEQGDWAMYCRVEPVLPDEIPDSFRKPPAELADFAAGHSIPLLIQAFHDNDPWRLWVEEVSSQREAAA